MHRPVMFQQTVWLASIDHPSFRCILIIVWLLHLSFPLFCTYSAKLKDHFPYSERVRCLGKMNVQEASIKPFPGGTVARLHMQDPIDSPNNGDRLRSIYFTFFPFSFRQFHTYVQYNVILAHITLFSPPSFSFNPFFFPSILPVAPPLKKMIASPPLTINSQEPLSKRGNFLGTSSIHDGMQKSPILCRYP